MSEVSRNRTEKIHISNLLRARLARMPRQIREIQPRNEKTTTNAIFRYRLADDIKEFFGVKEKAQKKTRPQSSSAGTSSPKKLMPTANDRKVSFDLEEKAQSSSSTDSANDRMLSIHVKVFKKAPSSSTDSESVGTKTIYMPIKQEADGKTAEAIILEDKQKADADLQELQDVKLEDAEKKK